LVVDSFEVGGAERHVVDLAVALSRREYEVTVACSVAGDLYKSLEEANVTVRSLLDQLVKRRVSAAYARALRRLTSTPAPPRPRSPPWAPVCPSWSRNTPKPSGEADARGW
jgi:hypothetical protein